MKKLFLCLLTALSLILGTQQPLCASEELVQISARLGLTSAGATLAGLGYLIGCSLLPPRIAIKLDTRMGDVGFGFSRAGLLPGILGSAGLFISAFSPHLKKLRRLHLIASSFFLAISSVLPTLMYDALEHMDVAPNSPEGQNFRNGNPFVRIFKKHKRAFLGGGAALTTMTCLSRYGKKFL